jgi:mono/diheme cytochrome c family protein
MKRLLLLLAVAIVAAAPVYATNAKADAGQVTFSEHVAPIFFANCVSCHRPGQVAPMSLLTYDEARPWAKSIRRATVEGAMPPWFANPAHGDFEEDSRLSAEQIDLIGRWVAAGAPAGDPTKMPEPPVFSTEWKIGVPDLILTMEPFEVTDDMEDHYEWRVIPNTSTEDRWIKSIEVRPTFVEGAHHNLTFIVPEGQGPEALGGERNLLVGWAPGAQPFRYPEGRGKLLPAKANVLFQMHYHKTPGPGTGGIDATSVAIDFYEPGEVVKPVTTMWVVDPALRIPAGEANYVSESEFVFEDDGVIYNFTPHMHVRGKAFTYTAIFPDGREEVLLDVPNYDFNWQLTYTPRQPLQVPKGTKVHCRAVFDNSAGNPSNPDPTVEVTWGEATTDEMMIGFMEYEYTNKAEMPTFAVPEHLREQMRRRLENADGPSAAAGESSGR